MASQNPFENTVFGQRSKTQSSTKSKTDYDSKSVLGLKQGPLSSNTVDKMVASGAVKSTTGETGKTQVSYTSGSKKAYEAAQKSRKSSFSYTNPLAAAGELGASLTQEKRQSVTEKLKNGGYRRLTDYSSAISSAESKLKKLEEEQSANKNEYQRILDYRDASKSNLDFSAQMMNSLLADYQQTNNPQTLEWYNNAVNYYQKMSTAYQLVSGSAGTSFDSFLTKKKELDSAYEKAQAEYNALLENQAADYADWRSRVRSDRLSISSELDAVNKEIDALKNQSRKLQQEQQMTTIGLNTARAAGNRVEGTVNSAAEQWYGNQVQDFDARIKALEGKRDLLEEEMDWSYYFTFGKDRSQVTERDEVDYALSQISDPALKRKVQRAYELANLEQNAVAGMQQTENDAAYAGGRFKAGVIGGAEGVRNSGTMLLTTSEAQAVTNALREAKRLGVVDQDTSAEEFLTLMENTPGGFLDSTGNWRGVLKNQLSHSAANEYRQKLEEKYDPGLLGKGLGEVTDAIGGMIPSMAAGVVNPALGMATLGLSAAGQSAQSAYEEGAGLDMAMLYGAGSGALEMGTEMLGAGLGGVIGKGLGGELVKKLTKNKLVQALADSLGEGVEEVISTVLDPYLKRAIYDADAQTATAEDILQSALLGAVVGGVFQGVDYAGKKVKGSVSKSTLPQSAELAAPSEMESGRPDLGLVNSMEGSKNAASTGETAGLVPYTEQEAVNLSTGKRNKLMQLGERIVSFVSDALKNRNTSERLYMGKIPDAVSKMVQNDTGVDISGFNAILDSDSVRHIFKHHGNASQEALRGQIAVTPEILEILPEVLSSPDRVYLSEQNDARGRSVLMFEKTLRNLVITAQAISRGKKTISTNTFYVRKGKDSQQGFNADTNVAPVHNVQNVLALSPSEDTVSQNLMDVNPLPMVERETAAETFSQKPAENAVQQEPVSQQSTVIEMDEEMNRRYDAATTETARSGVFFGATDEDIASAERISQATGRNILFYSGATETGVKAKASGFFSGQQAAYEPNTIYVNTDSGDPVATIIAHELTHSLEGTASYQKVEEYTLSAMELAGEDLDWLRELKYESYAAAGVDVSTLTDEYLTREVVAQYWSEHLLTDANSIQRLVEERPTLGQRILRSIRKLAAKFSPKSRERELLERAKDAYRDALSEAMSSLLQEATVSRANIVEAYRRGELTDEEFDAAIAQVQEDESIAKSGTVGDTGYLQENVEGVTVEPDSVTEERSESVPYSIVEEANASGETAEAAEGRTVDWDKVDEAREDFQQERSRGEVAAFAQKVNRQEEGGVFNSNQEALNTNPLPMVEQETAGETQQEVPRPEVTGLDRQAAVEYRQRLTGKETKFLERAERSLIWNLRNELHIKKGEYDDLLQGAVRDIADAYLTTGEVTTEQKDEIFDRIWDEIRDEEDAKQSYEAEYRQGCRDSFGEQVNDALAALRLARRTAEERSQKGSQAEEGVLSETDKLMEAYKGYKAAKRKEERAVAKNLLTESDKTKVGQLLRGDISPEMLESTDNVRGIMEVYEAKREVQETYRDIARYNAVRKENLRQLADRHLKKIQHFKDKKMGLAYSREIMERNIEDIAPDKETAKAINETYFTPIHEATAKANRLKEQYRQRVKEMNLSREVEKGNLVSESYAVQIIGEAMDNISVIENSKGRIKTREGMTLEEWRSIEQSIWDDNPNLDREKILKSIEEFRVIYDELFTMMNESRVTNGYEPVGYIKGYFPHFQAEDQTGIFGVFGKAMGIRMDVPNLPTTINGMTHTFKPGIQWFRHALKRKGYMTTYDAVWGFDMYVEGCADVIYQTENLQKLRALASEIRYLASDEGIRQQVDEIRNDPSISAFEKRARENEIFAQGKYKMSNFVVELEEYTNLLANKKSRRDRTFESDFGRHAYNVMSALNRRVGANMVALNPGSWLTNFIPLVQGGNEISTSTMMKAMWQTLQSYKASDGLVEESAFLTNRRGSDPIVKTWSEEWSGKLGLPMEYIDQFTADTLVRARVMQNEGRGLSHSEALSEADSWAARVMADRSKGSMPTIFSSTNPLLKLFSQFQLEVNNQFSHMFKDVPREYKDRGLAAIAGVLVKFLLGSWLFNEVYEFFVGRRPAFDPLDILNDTVGDLTGFQMPNTVGMVGDLLTGQEIDFTTERVGLSEAGTNLASNVAEELPFVSGLLGGGRIPIQSALPDVSTMWKAATNSEWDSGYRLQQLGGEFLKPLAYFAMPFGGGQMKKVLQGVQAMVQGGSYKLTSEGEREMQYPVINDNVGQLLGNSARIALFGKSALPTAQDWVEKDFDGFSARETAAYEGMVQAGVSGQDAYRLMMSIKDIDSENGNEKQQIRNLLQMSDISGDGKCVVYYTLLAEGNERKMELLESLADTSANMGDVTDLLITLDNIGAKGLKNSAQLKREAIANSNLDWNSMATVYYWSLGASPSKEKTLLEKLAGEDGYSLYVPKDSILPMVSNGIAMGDVIQTLCDIKAVEKIGDKRTALLQSDLSDELKRLIYTRYMVSSGSSDEEKIKTFETAGLSFSDFLQAKNAYSEIKDMEDLTAAQKATELARWVNQHGYTGERAETIKENLKFYSQIPGNSDKYDGYISIGLSDSEAAAVYDAMNALEPLEGEDNLKEWQKWKVACESISNPQQQMEVMCANAANAGTRAKIRAAYECGIAMDVYTAYLSIINDYDANANGSISQKEAKAAIEGLEASGYSLTSEEKAMLYQSRNKSWKPYKNPYNTGAASRFLEFESQFKEEEEAKLEAKKQAEKEGTEAEESSPWDALVLPSAW